MQPQLRLAVQDGGGRLSFACVVCNWWYTAAVCRHEAKHLRGGSEWGSCIGWWKGGQIVAGGDGTTLTLGAELVAGVGGGTGTTCQRGKRKNEGGEGLCSAGEKEKRKNED